jgi:hypothetical protein
MDKNFCSGLEHLTPWMELADYSRRLLRDTFDIRYNDFYLAVDNKDLDLELVTKMKLIHANKHELDRFYKKLKEKYNTDEYAYYCIRNEWNKFKADWDKFVRSHLYFNPK